MGSHVLGLRRQGNLAPYYLSSGNYNNPAARCLCWGWAGWWVSIKALETYYIGFQHKHPQVIHRGCYKEEMSARDTSPSIVLTN